MNHRQARSFNTTVSQMRQADAATVCIELHCRGHHAAEAEHTYGSPQCDWVLRMGTVVGKSELRSTKNTKNETNNER